MVMMLRAFVTIASSIALCGVASGAAFAQDAPPVWRGHMWGWGGPGYFFGPLMHIAMIALCVAAVILVIRWLSPRGWHHHHQGRGGSALAILEERFARGEIDKAEFEERRRILQG
jgi:putative membrane protein